MLIKLDLNVQSITVIKFISTTLRRVAKSKDSSKIKTIHMNVSMIYASVMAFCLLYFQTKFMALYDRSPWNALRLKHDPMIQEIVNFGYNSQIYRIDYY